MTIKPINQGIFLHTGPLTGPHFNMCHGDAPTRLLLSKGSFPGSSLSRHQAPHDLLRGNQAPFRRVGAKHTASSLCRSRKAVCVAQSQSGQSRGSRSDISRDNRQHGENKDEGWSLAEGFNQMKKSEAYWRWLDGKLGV